MNILTIYYSKTGENYYKDKIIDLKKGNSERAAEFIYKALGGRIYQVEPAREYPYEYEACCDIARVEHKENQRPEVKAFLSNVDDFDTIFVVYPCWCSTLPMFMFTFLDHYDLSGKRIFPLCTHEGSGMGDSVKDLKKFYPKAKIGKGLDVRGYRVIDSEEEIVEWAKSQL